MSNEIEVRQREDLDVQAASEAVGSDALLRLALEREGGIEVVERIVALREREQERRAEMAMAHALAAFQAERPPIKRTGKGHHGPFAPLEEIVRTVAPFLAEHGLSFTHDGSATNGEVTTTCTLRHVEGATRTATFTGPIDKSGGKNPIQMVSSARSYGRRYTLIDVLGLTTELDDDGQSAGSPPGTVTAEQAKDLEALAKKAGIEVSAFFDWLGISEWGEVPEDRYVEAHQVLTRRAKKAEAS
jgi:hypothetical protein